MKQLLFLLVLLAGTAQAEITTCTGQYALCAASTCKPTGKTITATSGESYPEVNCKCPILNGEAIADTTMGNMQGSCDATDGNHVWSLFAPKKFYPQEASNWSKLPQDMRVTVQECDASLNQGARASNLVVVFDGGQSRSKLHFHSSPVLITPDFFFWVRLDL